MPPAIPFPTVRPRSLANVLSDLKEARSDVDQAQEEIRHATLGMHARHYADLNDRATEAETRLDDLRDEFDARLLEATGLTLNALMKAWEEAVL